MSESSSGSSDVTSQYMVGIRLYPFIEIMFLCMVYSLICDQLRLEFLQEERHFTFKLHAQLETVLESTKLTAEKVFVSIYLYLTEVLLNLIGIFVQCGTI